MGLGYIEAITQVDAGHGPETCVGPHCQPALRRHHPVNEPIPAYDSRLILRGAEFGEVCCKQVGMAPAQSAFKGRLECAFGDVVGLELIRPSQKRFARTQDGTNPLSADQQCTISLGQGQAAAEIEEPVMSLQPLRFATL